MDPRNDLSVCAYFNNRFETLNVALANFLQFGQSLEGELIFRGNWVYSRTDEEAKNNRGFNPVAEPDIYLAFLREEFARKKNEFGLETEFGDAFTLKLPHASPSSPDDPYDYFDRFVYWGGVKRRQSDQLSFASETARRPGLFTLAEWTRLTELIIAWRVPRYIWFDSYLYELEGRIHKHRAWGGWLGWFPQRIDLRALPLGALAIPVGPGTLVASQQQQLHSEIPAQREQARQVELALVELGVLPTQDELLSASPPPPASGRTR